MDSSIFLAAANSVAFSRMPKRALSPVMKTGKDDCDIVNGIGQTSACVASALWADGARAKKAYTPS
jgi:hypothetical protein